MADKEKGMDSRALSALTLIPAAMGIVEYAPQLLDHLRSLSGDVSSTIYNHADDIFDFSFVRAKLTGKSDRSGAKAFDALLNRSVPNPLDNDLSQLLQRRKQSALTQHFQKIHEVNQSYKKAHQGIPIGQTLSGETLFRRAPKLQKYAAYLAYVWTYGQQPTDIGAGFLNESTLWSYAELFDKNIKRNDPDALKLKQTFSRLMGQISRDTAAWEERLSAAMHPAHGPSTRPSSSITGIDPSDPGLKKQIDQFVDMPADANSRWHSFMRSAGMPDQAPRQRMELLKTTQAYDRALKETQDRARKYAESAKRTYGPASPEYRRASYVYEQVKGVDLKVHTRSINLSGAERKSLVLEITSKHSQIGANEIEIPIQQGAFTSRNSHTALTTNLQRVPFGAQKVSESLDVTSFMAQRLQAMAPKFMRDLIGSSGNPQRGAGLIADVMEKAFGLAAPSSGSARDLLRASSFEFDELRLASGQGSRLDYRKVVQAVPSMQRLQKLDGSGQRILVFDMEFAHPDMNTLQMGPQKMVRSAETKVWQISAHVIDTAKWEQVSHFNAFINPGKKYIEPIREWYSTQMDDAAAVDKFLTKELQGDESFKSLEKALTKFSGYMQSNKVTHVMGQNITTADIPLLLNKLKNMKQGDVRSYLERMFRMDQTGGKDQVLIDTYDMETLLNRNIINRGKGLEDILKHYTGVDADGLLAVLKLSDSHPTGSVGLDHQISKIGKELGYKTPDKLARLRDLYDTVINSKIANPNSAIGAHDARFDVAMSGIVAMHQARHSHRFHVSEIKQRQLLNVAREVLSNGNTSWYSAFQAMDAYRPAAFIPQDAIQDESFALSLYTASQQQAAKLIGSSLQMQHLIPFGMLSNMMRQRYQAFAGWNFATPGEAAIREAQSAGFSYRPGELITTAQGREVSEYATRSTAIHPSDHGRLYNSQVATTLYLPEQFGGVYGDQAYVHEGFKPLTSYFRGDVKSRTIPIARPAETIGLTPWELFDDPRFGAQQGDLHPAIHTALQRRVHMAGDSVSAHQKAAASLTRQQISEVQDKFSREGMDAKLSFGGTVRNYTILPGESDLYTPRGAQGVKPVRYKDKSPFFVFDAMYDPASGSVVATGSHMGSIQPGTKVIGDQIKTHKSVVYGVFGNNTDNLTFFNGKPAMVVAGRFGGSRQELGSQMHVQLGRVLHKLHNDPRLIKDALALKRAAYNILSDYLGKEIKIDTLAVGVGEARTFRLQLELPNYNTDQLYKMVGGGYAELDMLKRAGITHSYINEVLNNDLAKLSTEQQLKLKGARSKAYAEMAGNFERTLNDLRVEAHDLPLSDEIHNKISYYQRLLKDITEAQKGRGDGASLFDLGVVGFGQHAAIATGFLAESSIRVVQDAMDFIEQDSQRIIESHNKLPIGNTRFRPYFTTLFQENLIKNSDNPQGLLNLLQSHMGIAYTNSAGQNPIAEGMGVLMQSVELLKRSASLAEGAESIEELLRSADWLEKYSSSDNKHIIQSVRGAQRYALLGAEQTKQIAEALSPDKLSEYRRLYQHGSIAEAEREVFIQQLMDSERIDREVAEKVLKAQDFRIPADQLSEIPIFDKNSKTRINLLKISDASAALKKLGYAKDLSPLQLSLKFGDDIIGELLHGETLSETQKRILKGRASKMGDLGGKVNYIPIVQTADAMAMYEFDHFGTKYVMGSNIDTIANIAQHHSKRELLIQDLADRQDYFAQSINKAALDKQASEIAMHTSELKENTRHYLKSVLGTGLKNLKQKANMLYAPAKYGVHASGFNSIVTVMDQILTDKAYRVKNAVSDQTFRHVLTQAAVGNDDWVKQAMTGNQEALDRLAEKLIRKNKNQVTFAGLGATEGIISRTEAGKIAAERIKRLQDVVDEGTLRNRTSELKTWLKGGSLEIDNITKEPSFTHSRVLLRGLAVTDDKVLELAGFNQTLASAHVFTNPFRSQMTTKQWDFDFDLVANIDMDFMDHHGNTLMKAYNKQQVQTQRFMETTDLKMFPIQSGGLDWQGNRAVFRRSDSNVITFDPQADFATPAARSAASRGKNIKDMLIIKSFTPLLGMSQMRLIGQAYGDNNSWSDLPELLRQDSDIAKAVYQTSRISASDAQEALDILRTKNSSAVAGMGDNLLDSYIGWRGMLSENIGIIKTKVTAGDLGYLDEFAKVLNRMQFGELTEADYAYLNSSETLKGNKAHFTDGNFLQGMSQLERNTVADKTMRAANTLSRAHAEANRVMHGTPDPMYKSDISKSGWSAARHLMAAWVNEAPDTLAPSVVKQRSGIEKIMGMAPTFKGSVSGSDIHVGNGISDTMLKASSLKGILRETLGEAADSIMNKFVHPNNWSGSMRAGALALGALAFFSPNMGVTPVGKGGEEYDWPSFPDVKNVSVRLPLPRTVERLMDAVEPGSARARMIYRTPSKPSYAYSSDLRRRNWTIDNYLAKSDAVLMT